MAEKIRAWEELTEKEQKRFLEIINEQHELDTQRMRLTSKIVKLESKISELDWEKKLLHTGKWLEAKAEKGGNTDGNK